MKRSDPPNFLPRPFPLVAALTFAFLVAPACDGVEGQEVREFNFTNYYGLGGLSLDTGYIGLSNVVRLQVRAYGGLKGTLLSIKMPGSAVLNGCSLSVSGRKGAGEMSTDVGFSYGVKAYFGVPDISLDQEVDLLPIVGLNSIDLELAASQAFDPFLLGSTATLTGELAKATVLDVDVTEAVFPGVALAGAGVTVDVDASLELAVHGQSIELSNPPMLIYDEGTTVPFCGGQTTLTYNQDSTLTDNLGISPGVFVYVGPFRWEVAPVRFGVPIISADVPITFSSQSLDFGPGSNRPPSSYSVTIQSQNAGGVPITATPTDALGRSAGATPLSLMYGQGTTITLSVPAYFQGQQFVAWDGVDSQSGTLASMVVNGNRTATALYLQDQPRQGNAISVASVSWDDSNGNQDGIIEGMEDINLRVWLASSSGASSIRGVLTSPVGSLNIFTPSAGYPDIPAGGSQGGAYMHVILNAASYTNLPLNFQVSYLVNGAPYYQNFALTETFYPIGLFVPSFALDHVTIDDSTGGNGDGVLQSGESAHVNFYLKNSGMAAASNVRASFSNLSVGTINGCGPGCAAAFYQYGDMPDDGSARGSLQYTPQVMDIPGNFVGDVTGDVTIIYNPSQTTVLLKGITLFSVQPATWIGVGPGQYDFGVHGTSGEITVPVTVHNYGSMPLHVTSIDTGYADTIWSVPTNLQITITNLSVPTNLPMTIAAGGSVNLQVTINPTNLSGQVTRTVTFVSDARPGGNVLTITGLVSDGPPIFLVPGITEADSYDCSSNIIVWADTQSIYQYDTSSGEASTIYTAATNWGIGTVRISGGLVAWETGPNGSYTATNATILGRDLTTGTDYAVSPQQAAQRLVGVDGHLIAFVRRDYLLPASGQAPGYDSGVYNAYGFNTADGSVRQLTSFSPTGNSPVQSVDYTDADFGGGILVFGRGTWTLNTYSTGSFWYEDGVSATLKFAPGIDSTPEPIQATNTAAVAANDGEIAYIQLGLGAGAGTNSLWLWEGGSARLLASIWGLDQEALALGAGQVVYSKWNDSGDGLYARDIATGVESILVPPDRSPRGAPRMDGSLAVWSQSETNGHHLCFTLVNQPIVSIAAGDISLSDNQPVEGRPFSVGVTVHNLARVAELGTITVGLYDGDASGANQLGTDQIVSGGLSAQGSAQAHFTNVVFPGNGPHGLCARVTVSPSSIPVNNMALVRIMVGSSQPNGPVVSDITFSEYQGHTNGIIGSAAKVLICWSVSDAAGISVTELLVDGVPAVVSGSNGNYCATVNPLAPGVHQASIIATDADAVPISSTNGYTFPVVAAEHLEVRYNGAAVTNGAVLDLGAVPLNSPQGLLLLLTNGGEQMLTLSAIAGTGALQIPTSLNGTSLTSNGYTSFTISLDTSKPGASAGTVSISSSDLSDRPFTLTISADVRPALDFSFAGGQLTLTWPVGFQLQSCTNLSNPAWTGVQGASSPFTVAMSLTRAFYRLSSAQIP